MSTFTPNILAPTPPPITQRRMLIWAFFAQLLLVLLCLGVMLKIYRGFETTLNAQHASQQQMMKELADQKQSLDDATAELGEAYFDGGLSLIRAKSPDAVRYFRNGVDRFPNDTSMRHGYVKALIVNSQFEQALKFASGLPVSSSDPRNLLTLALAKCAVHDAAGAAASVEASKLDPMQDGDLVRFCPVGVLHPPGR